MMQQMSPEEMRAVFATALTGPAVPAGPFVHIELVDRLPRLPLPETTSVPGGPRGSAVAAIPDGFVYSARLDAWIDGWRDHLHTWPRGVPDTRCYRCGLTLYELRPPPPGRPLSSQDPAVRVRDGGPWWAELLVVTGFAGLALIAAVAIVAIWGH